MPWLRIDETWYEVPEGTEPVGYELTYERPEEEDTTPLAAALTAGLLLWAWSPETARYVLVAEEAPVAVLNWVGVANYSQEAIRASSAATDFLASFLADGTLPAADWYRLMRQEIKEEVIRQYLLGRGGRAQMAAADWGSCGGMVREQYGWLEGFYDKIKAGELSEAQIRARAAMYVRSGREAFERGKARAFGLPELPAYPGDGQTVCLTNCYCNWRIEEVFDEDGNFNGWDCFWELNPAEHCDDCIENHEKWHPLFVEA